MVTTLAKDDLAAYVARQMESMFPDGYSGGGAVVRGVDLALERLEFCLGRMWSKYANTPGGVTFNHRNTDQYAMFLYLLSNSLHREGEAALASKAYALNKALHAIDVFYEVELPRVFFFQHPVGTVLGRGCYADYFMVYQRCSVGSNLDGVYPVFEEGVVMFGGSGVIGNCRVGANTWLSIGTLVMDRDVPPGSTVFGQGPNLVIKPARRDVRKYMFHAKEDS